MGTIDLYCREILQEYHANKAKGHPDLNYRIKEGKVGEAFSCHYASGEVCLEATSPVAAMYGLSHLTLAIASGHYAEFLGEWRPRFALRPLWIGCDVDVALTSRVGISVPFWMRHEVIQQHEARPALDAFCRRVIHLGYNSVIIGSRQGNVIAVPEDPFFDLEALCRYCHEYGLKVILKPSSTVAAGHKELGRCALNSDYVEAVNLLLSDLINQVPSVDYIFWEGEFLHNDCMQHLSAYDATQQDLAEAEITMLEAALQKTAISLIYFIPVFDEASAKQQTAWLPSSCDRVGLRTILAFSAVAGDFYADHLLPHPLWEVLRQSPDVSATPFLPIVNIGAVQQGEGLWPSLTLDLIEKYFTRCSRHHFAGIICLVNQVPHPGAFLECSLWVAAQILWKERPAALVAETWFRARRPEIDFPAFAEALREMRQLVVDLSLLRSLHNEKHCDHLSSEDCRIMANSSLARLKYLQIFFEKKEKKRLRSADKLSYDDYFSYFSHDAQRIIMHFLQRFNVSMLHQKNEEVQQEGFWTQCQGLNQGRRFHAKTIYLESPQRGVAGSRMEKIYRENYLFVSESATHREY